MTPNKFLKNMSGIYGIRNIVNDKIYVGRTKCMNVRCKQYIYDYECRAIGHLNDYLYNSISKYGLDKFEFFPLQFAPLNMLPDLEIAWMFQLKSTHRDFGYNLRMGNIGGMITHTDTAKKISNNLKQQWRDGTRDQHSEKMKKSWLNDSKRKNDQSKLMSKVKTKYDYELHHPDTTIETCDYKRLVDLGLKNVIANFHRRKKDDVMCKGYRVIRHKRSRSK